jgi:hypothetical protein
MSRLRLVRGRGGQPEPLFMEEPPLLTDPRVERLRTLILDSFRVRENQDPVYVDVANHLARVGAPQHLIVFGRRGSGKSSLLVHHHRQALKLQKPLSVYITADVVKTLPYPDLLIRLLLEVGNAIVTKRRSLGAILRRRSMHSLRSELSGLRQLLDQAAQQDVTDAQTRANTSRETANLHAGGQGLGGSLGAEEASATISQRTARFRQQKLEHIDRHLIDFRDAFVEAIATTGHNQATVLVDDFYLIEPALQPDVIDYLHRLLRGTSLYLKIGTVRHRTVLGRQNGRLIGVELYQDVEELDLDQTFENVTRTQDYLRRMLDTLAVKVDLTDVSAWIFNPDGLLSLTLASGGVPRDFLTIFVEAIEIAVNSGQTRWLTPSVIYKAGDRVSYRTKLSNLRDDVGDEARRLEAVYQDLLTYCLVEKRKTAFLIAQDEVTRFANEHELIKQLMDFKLIHVIEADTSAASGRPGRYEAYTLDFSLFMEPRLRGIEVIEFWRLDAQRRRRGLREAPVYPLSRAVAAEISAPTESTEQLVQSIERQIGVEPAAE